MAGYSDYWDGKEGVIVEFAAPYVRVDFDHGPKNAGFYEKNLELVERPRKFKVGDKVRVTGEKYRGCYWDGKEGPVTEILGGLYVVADGAFTEDQLSPALRFKAGDRVLVTAATDACGKKYQTNEVGSAASVLATLSSDAAWDYRLDNGLGVRESEVVAVPRFPAAVNVGGVERWEVASASCRYMRVKFLRGTTWVEANYYADSVWFLFQRPETVEQAEEQKKLVDAAVGLGNLIAGCVVEEKLPFERACAAAWNKAQDMNAEIGFRAKK